MRGLFAANGIINGPLFRAVAKGGPRDEARPGTSSTTHEYSAT
jgi:hypothetical protein